MTMTEFQGVRCADIDIETGERLTHQALYRRTIERLGGLEKVKPYIPFGLNSIRKALSEDEYLNNLCMESWDAAAGFRSYKSNCVPSGYGLWDLYRTHGITSASCAQGVCILKEAARWWAEIESENENGEE